MDTASPLSSNSLLPLRIPAAKPILVLRTSLAGKARWPTQTGKHGFVVGCHIIHDTNLILREPFGDDRNAEWNEGNDQYRESCKKTDLVLHKLLPNRKMEQ